jgi:hypothetical protein
MDVRIARIFTRFSRILLSFQFPIREIREIRTSITLFSFLSCTKIFTTQIKINHVYEITMLHLIIIQPFAAAFLQVARTAPSAFPAR